MKQWFKARAEAEALTRPEGGSFAQVPVLP
jgi:hypothetical protein